MNIIYLEKIITDEEIKNLVSFAYGVSSTNIIVCHDYGMADLFEDGELTIPESVFDNSHIVERIVLKPDFPILLNIYPLGELNNDKVYTNELIAKKIAKMLKCNCMISDYESEDLYAYRLVQPDGNIVRVGVDPDILDDEKSLVIIGSDED